MSISGIALFSSKKNLKRHMPRELHLVNQSDLLWQTMWSHSFMKAYQLIILLCSLNAKLLQPLQTTKAQTQQHHRHNHRVLWRAPRCYGNMASPTFPMETLVRICGVGSCLDSSLYLSLNLLLCRRFCRFIERLLQSRPQRPFISYRTFYLGFMEHAIRPDILRVPK